MLNFLCFCFLLLFWFLCYKWKYLNNQHDKHKKSASDSDNFFLLFISFKFKANSCQYFFNIYVRQIEHFNNVIFTMINCKVFKSHSKPELTSLPFLTLYQHSDCVNFCVLLLSCFRARQSKEKENKVKQSNSAIWRVCSTFFPIVTQTEFHVCMSLNFRLHVFEEFFSLLKCCFSSFF
jgi:hypothetical protein